MFMYDLGALYGEELSTPSKDEQRFGNILQEKGRNDLADLALQKLCFRVDECIATDPFNEQDFISLFAGWWKAAKGVDTFDWGAWRREALEKYGDGVGVKESTQG